MAQSPEYPELRWMPPRSYTKGRWDGQPTKIVVHYTAGAERSTSAEDGAAYDQRRTDGTSAHYYVDSNSVVQCVRTTDRSHTALYRGNNAGIHYELCGTRQTRAQWLDGASRATIRNAARQMARDMAKYGIPLRRLVNRDVRDQARKGICGHADFTYGWPEDGGTHTDPGEAFPWDVLFDDIREFMEDEMTPEETFNAVWHRDALLTPEATDRWMPETYFRKIVAEQRASKLRDEAILAAVEGIDDEGILARVDQHAAAQADAAEAAATERAEIRDLVEKGQSGQLAADEVVRLIGERLTATPAA